VRKSGADILTWSKTTKAQTELERLRNLPNSEIDFSDIPEMTPEQLARFMPAAEFWKVRKKQITLRVDADVLAWFQNKGEGYLTRMNDVLRGAMLAGVSENRKQGRK
jgi:uncharacterized protein (DUF4415 family)